MDKIRVLFFNQSNGSDAFSQDIEDILAYLISRPSLILEQTVSIEDAKEKLADNNHDVLIMWVDHKNYDAWHQLDNFMEESETLYYLGFIVIFSFKEGNLLENAREAMLRRIYPFVCPIDFEVFLACIEALDSKMKYKKSLADLKNALLKADSLDSIVKKALQQLNTHPLVGYDGASISLVDRTTKIGKRYLLKIDPPSLRPDRSLQKDIHGDKALLIFWWNWYLAIRSSQLINAEELDLWFINFISLVSRIAGDKLMMKVDRETVVIIEDIESLSKKQLIDFGWKREVSTQDIKSWIGLAAKHQDQTVAVITLHHKISGKYKKSSQKLIEYLRNFGEIFADAIQNFFLKRNECVIKAIINEMGDDLKSEDLVRQILQKLKDELHCHTCNYFLVSYDSDNKEILKEEWRSAKDDSDAIKKLEKSSHKFKKGDGIVGAVLKDGKSRIVPNASEDKEFLPTLNHPGYNLSMLAVPVIPISNKHSNKPNRIIGVICCYEEKPDYFTVYDRDLVEDIALSAATVIERTMTLEFSNDISSEMAKLVLDTDKSEKLLKQICNHALRVTSAGSASIHLLNYLEKEKKYIPIKIPFYTYPHGEEADPRLNGYGTTDLVIEKGKTVEFSEHHRNFYRIAPEQIEKGVKYKIVVPLLTSKDNQQLLIGALYLNKYSEEPLSKVEKFALELLASQAASIIYDQKILSENKFMADAHEHFVRAIQSIADNDNIDLLLRDIAKYSCSLVNANFSYLVIRDITNNFKVKAAWPEYILTDLKSKHREDNKIGITGLVSNTGESILINDIHEHKKNNSEYGQAYIEFKKDTCSELAVPILEKDGTVIGIINLEHRKPYAFTRLHQTVIEHFARQVAIAFQKKNLIDRIRSNNRLLTTLHQSFPNIMSESAQNILYQVVSTTPEALGAKEVIVITYKKGKDDHTIDEIFPPRCNYLIKDLKKISLDVYVNQEEKIYRDGNIDQNNKGYNQIKFEKPVISGLCFPLSSGLKKMGVIWILFSKSIDQEQLEEDKDVYKVYINQIALAYENATRLEELKKKASEDLSKDIKIDYKYARQQATFFFVISVVASITGLGLIFAGVPQLLKSDAKNIINGGGISAVTGVILEAVTILAFNRAKEANERLDRYHQEIYHVGELSILLSATEQLDPQIVQEEKKKIIQTTTNHWLNSINDVRNTDKVNEVKKNDK
ncbi:GAF domain-containing protein [Nostoc linckia FACHB-104]|nr:GAF domain-containing protein [Nostoc linckia FACHB-104]